MAKIYGDIIAKALMTFDKSFARSNGQPLDSTEIFYSLSAAETYAAGDVAYVGQKIAVVVQGDEATTVTHYGIEADGTLKELGAKVDLSGYVTEEKLAEEIGKLVDANTTYEISAEGVTVTLTPSEGDPTTATLDTYTKEEIDDKFEGIVIPEVPTVDGRTIENNEGVLGLANVDDLTFKQTVGEGEEATEQDVSSYNVVIKKNTQGKAVVEYVIPSATTVEGLDTRLSVVEGDMAGIKESVGDLEDAIVGLTGAMHFVGTTDEEPTSPVIKIDGVDYTAAAGDVVLFENKEYVYDGANWALFGDAGDLVTKSELTNYYTKTEADAEFINAEELAEAIGKINIPQPDGNTEYELSGEGLVVLLKTIEGTEAGSATIDTYTKNEIDQKIGAINDNNTLYEISNDGVAITLTPSNDLDEASTITLPVYTKDEVNDLIPSLEGYAKEADHVSDAELTEVLKSYPTHEQLATALVGYAKEADHISNDELATALTPYAKTEDLNLANIVRGVKLGDNANALSITNNTVTIPVASASSYGVVKSSDAADSISVYMGDPMNASDPLRGTMTVNSLNVNKLYQTDYIILNGGNAALNQFAPAE